MHVWLVKVASGLSQSRLLFQAFPLPSFVSEVYSENVHCGCTDLMIRAAPAKFFPFSILDGAISNRLAESTYKISAPVPTVRTRDEILDAIGVRLSQCNSEKDWWRLRRSEMFKNIRLYATSHDIHTKRVHIIKSIQNYEKWTHLLANSKDTRSPQHANALRVTLGSHLAGISDNILNAIHEAPDTLLRETTQKLLSRLVSVVKVQPPLPFEAKSNIAEGLFATLCTKSLSFRTLAVHCWLFAPDIKDFDEACRIRNAIFKYPLPLDQPTLDPLYMHELRRAIMSRILILMAREIPPASIVDLFALSSSIISEKDTPIPPGFDLALLKAHRRLARSNVHEETEAIFKYGSGLWLACLSRFKGTRKNYWQYLLVEGHAMTAIARTVQLGVRRTYANKHQYPNLPLFMQLIKDGNAKEMTRADTNALRKSLEKDLLWKSVTESILSAPESPMRIVILQKWIRLAKIARLKLDARNLPPGSM